MPIISVYSDLLADDGSSASARCPQLFAGLDQTFGPDLFGPGGASAVWRAAGATLGQQIRAAVQLADWEFLAADALRIALSWLPGADPDLYLGTLLGLAPAATISIADHPAIVLALDRFAGPPTPPPRYFYAADEAPEIIAHEACHTARLQALGLPATPRLLTLQDMLLLEGTAILLTDSLANGETLGRFMPAARLEMHRRHDQEMRAAAYPDFAQSGMGIFLKYFSAESPISGYYLGWSLAKDYRRRTGQPLAAIVSTPTQAILAELGLGP